MPAAPLEQTKKNFNTRAELATQLVSMVDRMRGDSSDEDVKKRLMGLSNKKLLRLYAAGQRVRERFGSRDKLIERIVSARQEAGVSAGPEFSKKIEGFSTARLLDVARQKFGARPAKITPEQKLKSKRGKKTRERALAKIKT